MTKEKVGGLHRVHARRWVAMSTVAAAGLALGAPAAASPSGGTHEDAARAHAAMTKPALHLAAAGKSSEGGEGGEGGEAGAARPGDEDAAFLADLAYVEGHLRAGVALYEAGAADMAKTHMKHPEDEIYADLRPQLDSRGAEQFDGELSELAAAVEGGASVEATKEAFEEVEHEIEEARERVGGGEAARLKAIVLIVREAAAEYNEGVKDGKVVETHEYQDAWGFLQAAKAMTGELAESPRPEVRDAVAQIEEQFEALAIAFPALVPTAETEAADPSVLFAAAARMELAALTVK
jgi:hypothetical protein